MVDNILTAITGAFTSFGNSIVGAIKSLFNTFLFESGADGALSNIATFMLVFLGISIIVGLVWLVIGLFRRSSRAR